VGKDKVFNKHRSAIGYDNVKQAADQIYTDLLERMKSKDD
jgi:hypothetical protein